MHKDEIESKSRRMGTAPIYREDIGNGVSLLIAEGYSSPPHLYAQRLGLEPESFPEGMLLTLYWFEKDNGKVVGGSGNFYSAFNTSQHTRIDDTKRVAKWMWSKLEEARKEREHSVIH